MQLGSIEEVERRSISHYNSGTAGKSRVTCPDRGQPNRIDLREVPLSFNNQPRAAVGQKKKREGESSFIATTNRKTEGPAFEGYSHRYSNNRYD